MHKILNNTKGDRWIWLIVILLVCNILMLAVYSSTGTLAYKRGKWRRVDFDEAPVDDCGAALC
jgi:hypothetical protein